MNTKKNKNDDEKRSTKYLLFLSFSTLGVVYGDIGTSPLYAFRFCFTGAHSVQPSKENILGILSLIFWSLVIVISIKYLVVILKADNKGEGGILALMELVLPKKGRLRGIVLILGLFGAALLYGDGSITPAISVISAIEGLNIATPVFEPYIVYLTLVILFFLFLLQRRGTGSVGLLFGPIMMLWFLVIATLGVEAIIKNPSVFAALNPYYAFKFFVGEHIFEIMFILGAVFLVVTGGEALYADIGHFGRKPIRLSWFALVLPCLLLNYFGQGALLLSNSSAKVNPFYHLAPSWGLYPMVILATCATIIASQAIISGVFSLTFQALQLGYLPRLAVRHTSEEERGQIFIPQVNWILFIATAGIVIGFQSSDSLAAAYGVAVSTTMVITSLLGFVAMRNLWKWSLAVSISITVFFLIIDFSFFFANILKITRGGWLPLVLGGIVYLLMSTWLKGQKTIANQLKKLMRPLKTLPDNIDRRKVKSVPGTAVYMTRSPLSTPPAFMYNLEHNKAVHRTIIFMSVGVKNIPFVAAEDRIKFERMEQGFYRVLVRYGYMNRTDISAVMEIINSRYIKIDMNSTSFFLGRSTLIPSKSIGMSPWQNKLYIFMSRNSSRASNYFNLPLDRVFEIGAEIKF